MEIRVTRLKDVRRFMGNIEPQLQKQVGNRGTIKLAENLRRRIKRKYTSLGYGKGDSSGRGFKSIISKPTSKGAKVIVGKNAPWMILLEEGRADHLVSPYTIQKHLRSPGSTIGKRAPQGKYGGQPIMWHWKGPFIEPAMKLFKPQIPRLLIKFVERALSNAK